MPARTTRRRCAAIIADLDIPQPFDVGRFLSRLAAKRNRMIFLHPFTSGPGIPCGLWLGTARADHIFHEEGTSPWHQTHIKLHEVAHMLLSHSRGGREGSSLGRLLAPDLDPALIRLVLGRSTYTTAEERDAETLASLILGQASNSPAPLPAMGIRSAEVLRRLERAWGYS
jgi:plasmid stabilization system protein ParE